MKRISTCTLGMTGLLVLWLLVGAAWPAPSGANGLNLSWDACGHAGASNKAFACNTNVGEEKLVLSGIFPVASLLPEIRYIADLDFASGENELPSWWAFAGATACRPSAVSMNLSPVASEWAGCQWSEPAHSAYSLTWTTTASTPMRRRLTISATPLGNLDIVDRFDSLETWVGTVRISHAKTAGVGSCAGCATPVCIVFNSLQVFESAAPEQLRSYVSTPLERNFVTWQGGATGMAICPAATPALRRTWGALKSLYP